LMAGLCAMAIPVAWWGLMPRQAAH